MRKSFSAALTEKDADRLLTLRRKCGVTTEGIFLAGIESIEKRIKLLKPPISIDHSAVQTLQESQDV